MTAQRTWLGTSPPNCLKDSEAPQRPASCMRRGRGAGHAGSPVSSQQSAPPEGSAYHSARPGARKRMPFAALSQVISASCGAAVCSR